MQAREEENADIQRMLKAIMRRVRFFTNDDEQDIDELKRSMSASADDRQRYKSIIAEKAKKIKKQIEEENSENNNEENEVTGDKKTD